MRQPHVRIQTDVCCGFGNCALVCPDVFVLDHESNRVRLAEGAPVAVQREQIARAVQECPTQAITMVDADA